MKMYRILLKKELRLQKNNFWFLGGAVLLAVLTILLNHSPLADIPLALGTVRDIFIMVLTILTCIVFTIIIPVLFGATSIAEEKRLKTKDWQIALPVSPLKEILVKCAVVLSMAVLSGGVIARLVDLAFGESFLYFGMVRGNWPGGLAVFMGAVGMFTSSFARDPYRAMILSAPVVALYAAVIFLIDRNQLVFPFASSADYVSLVTFSSFNTLFFYIPGFILLVMAYKNFTAGDANYKVLWLRFGLFLGAVGCLTVYAIDKRYNIFAPAKMASLAEASSGIAIKKSPISRILAYNNHFRPYNFDRNDIWPKSKELFMRLYRIFMSGQQNHVGFLDIPLYIRIDPVSDAHRTDSIITGSYFYDDMIRNNRKFVIPFAYDYHNKKMITDGMLFKKNLFIHTDWQKEPKQVNIINSKTYDSGSSRWKSYVPHFYQNQWNVRKPQILAYTEKDITLNFDDIEMPSNVTTETLPQPFKALYESYGNRFHTVPLIPSIPALEHRLSETSDTVQFCRIVSNQDYKGKLNKSSSYISHDPFQNRGAFVRLETSGTKEFAHVTVLDFDTMEEYYVGTKFVDSFYHGRYLSASWTKSGKFALWDSALLSVFEAKPLDKIRQAPIIPLADRFSTSWTYYEIRNFKDNSLLFYSSYEFLFVVDLDKIPKTKYNFIEQ